MKKILILGSGGMLGHMVYHYFKSLNKYNLIDLSFHTKINPESHLLDVTKKMELKTFILTNKPDIIINCIGVLLKGSSEDPSNAIFLNSYFPHLLVKLLRTFSGKLIHISTDCVFSGKKGQYTDSDYKDARDIYGLSKALGEVDNHSDLTLRTSIIGPELKENGEGLFSWFMHQKGSINGFTNAIWGGVTTLELAKVIDYAINQEITGLIHVSNGVSISKFEILSLLKQVWNKTNVNIVPSEIKPTDKSLVKSNKFDFEVLSYPEMLSELYAWMKNCNYLYDIGDYKLMQ